MIWLGEVPLVPCRCTATDAIDLIKTSNTWYSLIVHIEYCYIEIIDVKFMYTLL